MVQGPLELAKQLSAAHPGFDVVVATSQFADVLEREPVMLNNDKTMLVQVGRRGKTVGALGLFPDEARKLRFHLVTLDSANDSPESPMKKIIEGEYRSMLKAAGVVETFPRHDYAAGTAGATFIGAETCKTCHPNTYMKWSTTKHAQAYVSLEKDLRPDVVFDAECITCHTTGFEYNSGWRSAAATPQLRGNQCENCHGPASKHISDPRNVDYRTTLKVSAEQADKNGLCIRCHDEDNSPKYDFKIYYGQIIHMGLDDYSNPRVRQGISPKVARTPETSSGK
jgi:hypothetical protein